MGTKMRAMEDRRPKRQGRETETRDGAGVGGGYEKSVFSTGIILRKQLHVYKLQTYLRTSG